MRQELCDAEVVLRQVKDCYKIQGMCTIGFIAAQC